MDILDALLAAMPPSTGSGRRTRTPAENTAYGLATIGFPLLLALLIVFAGLWAHPVAILVVAGLLLVATYVVARLMQVGLAETLHAVIAAAVSLFLWGGVAFLVAVFGSFYSTF